MKLTEAMCDVPSVSFNVKTRHVPPQFFAVFHVKLYCVASNVRLPPLNRYADCGEPIHAFVVQFTCCDVGEPAARNSLLRGFASLIGDLAYRERLGGRIGGSEAVVPSRATATH